MPAKSIAQQRLMGQAYALKRGDIQLSDIDPEYRDEIKSLADGMTLKQLKDYAETKHTGLPNKVNDSLEPGNIPGMGNPEFPGDPGTLNSFEDQATGSGDIPHQLSSDEDEEERLNKWILTFEQFTKNKS
jgi:hypothetical protein